MPKTVPPAPGATRAPRTKRRRTLVMPVLATLTAAAVGLGVVHSPLASAFGDGAPVGIDVSSWQHPGGAAMDWSSVKAEGNSFAFIKATEGLGYVNPYFATDSVKAKDQGLIIGSYHYGRPGSSARAQAAEYAAVLATQPQPSLPPALDIEVNDGVSPAGMVAWIREFVTEIQRLTGRTPLIYTYRYFWQEQVGNSTEFSNYPLWFAAYQSQPPTNLPGGWQHMTFWQDFDKAKIPGVYFDTDTNKFNGTREQLDDFVSGNSVSIGGVLTPSPNLEVASRAQVTLETLGKENPQLVSAVLAVATGVAGATVLLAAARQAGFDIGPAQGFVDEVTRLADAGVIPVADLQRMLVDGTYTIGDLLLLLNNVAKAEGML